MPGVWLAVVEAIFLGGAYAKIRSGLCGGGNAVESGDMGTEISRIYSHRNG